MREYRSDNPKFSETIMETETTDTGHASHINASPEQLLQNDLVLKQRVDALEEKHKHGDGHYLPSVSLGTSYTEELKQDISSGKFEKAIVGGYLTINGHVYDFAHADYWLHTGDTECTAHHMVVVPRANLVTAQMRITESGQYDANGNTTEGAYIGSDMYKNPNGGLAKIKEIIEKDFGAENILTHREYFSNTVKDGYESAGSWYNSGIDLMNEQMVHGCVVFGNVLNGTNITNSYTIDKSQLELFARRPDLICNRAHWWLRDVVSSAYFAHVNGNGLADCYYASYPCGVRPAFAIC